MNAQVTPVRHKNVKGIEEFYLRVGNKEGEETLIVVGKKALESVESIVNRKTKPNAVGEQK